VLAITMHPYEDLALLERQEPLLAGAPRAIHKLSREKGM
jgi:hypothetical protein